LFAHSHCPWMELLVVQFLPRSPKFYCRPFIVVVTVGKDGTGQVFPCYCHSIIAPCGYLIQLSCTLLDLSSYHCHHLRHFCLNFVMKIISVCHCQSRCLKIVWTLTLRWLMSYIYGVHILDVFRSHTTTQHIR
jgi:hypothetical protein